jgi:hypothetical protein
MLLEESGPLDLTVPIGDGWTPRELRTSFVSLGSYRGVSIEEIARLVGHASTRTTEIVYRRELRSVITTGTEIMDQLLIFETSQARDVRLSASCVQTATRRRPCHGTVRQPEGRDIR